MKYDIIYVKPARVGCNSSHLLIYINVAAFCYQVILSHTNVNVLIETVSVISL